MLIFFDGSSRCITDHLGVSLVDFINVRDSSVAKILLDTWAKLNFWTYEAVNNGEYTKVLTSPMGNWVGDKMSFLMCPLTPVFLNDEYWFVTFSSWSRVHAFTSDQDRCHVNFPYNPRGLYSI